MRPCPPHFLPGYLLPLLPDLARMPQLPDLVFYEHVHFCCGDFFRKSKLQGQARKLEIQIQGNVFVWGDIGKYYC